MKKLIIKYGTIYAIVSIIFYVLYIFGVLSMMTNFIISIIVLAIVFWLAAKDYKAGNGGYASFGSLVKTYFLILVVGGVVSMIYSVVQNNLLSTEKKEEIVNRMIDSQLSLWSKLMKNNESLLVEMEDQIRQDMTVEKVFGVKNQLVGVLINFFVYVILVIIGAAIFKKVPKV
ncbi:MAG: DUF4199 domain-containing protein [Saprospiraceae bacterium]|nr:DUF4199 domain-containing protein [Saprospiraceae bacterium]